MQNHVSFLQEELLKLPSFPRKALETEFGLHHGDNGKACVPINYNWNQTKTKLIVQVLVVFIVMEDVV